MARLGRAAVPLDLMTYRPEDQQPSIFLLSEDRAQKILAVFNWTEEARSHTLALADLGLKAGGSYRATNVLRGGQVPIESGRLAIALPPHSVRILKLIDTSVPELAPAFQAQAPTAGAAGEALQFHAGGSGVDAPVLGYHWEFGDGVSADGADVTHAYTEARQYTVTVTATGLNRSTSENTLRISVSGTVPTVYDPAAKTRYIDPKQGLGPG
jgi:hypothetical protein